MGWWRGDGDATDVAGGFHGTLFRGASFATGKVGTAFKFDGVDDGEVAAGLLSRVTTAAGEDRDPAWSPDGGHLAFTSERDGNREIYVARADGGDVRRLTNDLAKDASPTWSPDGSRILFVAARTGTSELHQMTADGLRVEKLTSGANASSDVPRWSPDGSHVAFQIAEGSRYDIGLLRLRDRQQKVLVGTPDNDGSYTWSPDGTRLAYISGRNGAENLHVIDVESYRSTRITATWSLTPSWTQ